jgi:hypothetical protein
MMHVFGKRIRQGLAEGFQARAVVGLRRGDRIGVTLGPGEEEIEVLYRPGACTPHPGDILAIATVNGGKPFVLPPYTKGSL